MERVDAQLVLDSVIELISHDPSAEAFSDAVALLSALKAESPVIEAAYNRHVREAAKAYVPHAPAGEVMGIATSIEAMLKLDSRDDLDAYMQFTEWNRDPAKRFYQPRREKLWPLVCDLQDLEDGQTVFQSLSTPPRIGKSTLGCFFMSFTMGRHPELACLMTGYSDVLTNGFHAEVLSIITSEEYRFAEVFPDVSVVSVSMKKETIQLSGSSSRFPTLTCRSAEGTLTGAVEVGNVLYCDDMVSDREEALNADRMEKLYAITYLNQIADRKKDGAKELHIGTRWVPNDIIGRIQDEYRGDHRYRFSTMPALDESKATPEHPHGTSNFDYQFGVGFTTEYYEDQRRRLVNAGEEDSWSAKFMCSPYWKEGRLFTESDVRWFDGLPTDPDGEEMEPDAVYAVCDTKTKGPDYCAMPIVAVFGDDHYVIDAICDDGMMDGITPKIVQRLCMHQVNACRIESNVAGGVIAKEIERDCEDAGLGISITTKYSTMNKETRILADAGWVKQRCLFAREGTRFHHREYGVFMKQLMSYSAKGKNAHDDVPDAMSMYKRFVSSATKVKVTAMARPF